MLFYNYTFLQEQKVGNNCKNYGYRCTNCTFVIWLRLKSSQIPTILPSRPKRLLPSNNRVARLTQAVTGT